MSEANESWTAYQVYLIKRSPRHDATTDRWTAWPKSYTNELPFLYSNVSEEDLKKIIDAVLAVPEEQRFKTAEQWNAYLRDRGII